MPSEKFLAQVAFLKEQVENFKKHSRERTSINIVALGCSSTSKNDDNPRKPTSHQIMYEVFEQAKILYPQRDIQMCVHILEDIDFDICEGNYSIKGSYCTRPCRNSQMKVNLGNVDPLTQLYNDIVDWADIILIATPIRWGTASALYFKLVERLNCIENQKEVYGVDLVHDKLVGMIIVGAQDGVQHVMGQIMSTWSQLGFTFAKSPYVCYTSGGFLNTKPDRIHDGLKEDQEAITAMIHEMLDNQIKTIDQRRYWEQNKEEK